jgi:hypothetical protein
MPPAADPPCMTWRLPAIARLPALEPPSERHLQQCCYLLQTLSPKMTWKLYPRTDPQTSIQDRPLLAAQHKSHYAARSGPFSTYVVRTCLQSALCPVCTPCEPHGSTTSVDPAIDRPQQRRNSTCPLEVGLSLLFHFLYRVHPMTSPMPHIHNLAAKIAYWRVAHPARTLSSA